MAGAANHVELIAGDRLTDLAKLHGRRWDLVIDTSGYQPGAVAASARALAESVEHYTFISTISVYPWPIPRGTTEDDAVDVLGQGYDADGDEPQTYGQRKALCELEVASAYPGRWLAIRPGMIVGPYDETERFTYWIERAARGGTMLAPGDPSRALQLIDVADLARFTLALAQQRSTGVVNMTGPLESLTWNSFLGACISETRSDGNTVWLADEELTSRGFTPGSDFPWWLPSAMNGIFELNIARARAHGLKCRPLRETIGRTWEWLRMLPDEKRPVLLDPGRENELIAATSRKSALTGKPQLPRLGP